MPGRTPYAAREYQKLITQHILDVPRCAVWSSMGTGKTVSTYTALSTMHLAGDDHPTLVLAPKRVARSTWPKESRKWGHLRHIDVVAITGSEKERLAALARDVSVKTLNFDNLPWLLDHYGVDRWPFDKLVVDEATRLKGFRLEQGGARAAALSRVAHKFKHVIELTGTPSPNGLADLWGQAWFLDQGVRLGRTYTAFKQRWFQKSFDGYSVLPLPYAQAQIQAALADLCITIDAKDWFDINEPIVTDVYVDLPAPARKLYRDMETAMYLEIGDRSAEAFNAAARTQKLLQLANGAVYVDPLTESDEDRKHGKEWRELHDEKLQALESILEEANGMPALVAYEFKSDLARLQKAFPKARRLIDEHDEDDWNAGKIPMLLVHPKSAGHGLNLQDGGNILVFFGHNWNLEEYLQVIERIGPVRQLQSGHERPVFIYHIIAHDTVDEDVMLRRDSKKAVQDVLLEAMKRRHKK